MQRDIDHIREIETVARAGTATCRDPVVLASWLRCLDTHGLDPAERRAAHIVTEGELHRHRQRSEALIAIARSGIDGLYKLVAGQDYVLLLADADGVTVEYLGEDRHKQALRDSGLFMGAEWSEARAGTCAVGACIETGEPLIIHQSDHFDVTHGGLSCTAAPIFDSEGRLSAVLDISLLASPRPRESQVLALNLVRQAARRIEMANLMAESRSDWVLRLSGAPDFLDIDPEAAVTLDARGHVIGMTNGAARLMARAAGHDWRAAERLIGRPVSAFLDLDFGRIEDLTRQVPPRDRLIGTRDGYRLFAHAIAPRRPAATPVPRPRRLPPPLRELAGEDEAMTVLLRRAAELGRAGLPVLITGESGSGKTTLARALHGLSGRGPCVTVACEGLDEAEAAAIFGREERRAFRPGLLTAAEGGTLILDNLDELPLRLQARLPMLLAEGRYRPIGAMRERPASVRIIATLARGPEAAAEAGVLRRDLWLRLAGAWLALPPLRARADRLGLADRVFARAFGARVGFDAPALAMLAAHGWPGNLHEMDQLARAAAVAAERGPGPIMLGAGELQGLGQDGNSPGADAGRAVLARHLSETGWNLSETARRLGVDRSTVYRRMARHGLARD